MSSPKGLLHQGELVDEDPRIEIKSQQLESLERKIKEKRAELADIDAAGKAIASRLYNAYLALQAFFEIHEAPSGSPGPVASTANNDDRWEKIKAKTGGKMAQIIEALQLTGVATRTQLQNQTGGAMGTIDQAVYKLRDMGLLVKNGDGWSLKP